MMIAGMNTASGPGLPMPSAGVVYAKAVRAPFLLVTVGAGLIGLAIAFREGVAIHPGVVAAALVLVCIAHAGANVVERMRVRLLEAGHLVTARRAGVATRELDAHDAVIVGGSIRYGRHAAALEAFIRTNAAALSRRPAVFFTVCMAAAHPSREKQAAVDRFAREFAATLPDPVKAPAFLMEV